MVFAVLVNMKIHSNEIDKLNEIDIELLPIELKNFLRWSYFLVFVAHFFLLLFILFNFESRQNVHYMLLAIEVQKFKTHSVQNVHTQTHSCSLRRWNQLYVSPSKANIEHFFDIQYNCIVFYAIQYFSFHNCVHHIRLHRD